MNILKSRTVWTIIIMLGMTTLETAHNFLSPDQFLLAQSILSALAVYFRINPKQ